MKTLSISASVISASVLLFLVCSTSAASAQQHSQYGLYGSPSVLGACEAGCRSNQMWPSQYVPAARRSVQSAYEIMINNGWRRQNLLGAYHFNPNSNELTEAGKLKVKWILSQAPQHRRSIFVERGADPSRTAARVASINDWASNMRPSVGTVDINDTHIVAEGHPASAVDHIFVGFQTNQPAPVLPAATTSSSSGSTN